MNQASTRTLVVILLLVAALFVAMNRIAQAAPLVDWWLVAALLLLALLVAMPERLIRRSSGVADVPEATASTVHVYTPQAPVNPVYPPAPSVNADMEDDYGRIRDTEVRADVMASATHMETLEALENEGMVENVMAYGATGEHHEVDEIAGAPVKSTDRTATQEMRAVSVLPDDLTIVEGIGPKMAAALQAAGINTYTQLTGATLPDLETAVRDAGMRFAPSMPTWAEQAAYAARGDWDGLKAFQKTLKSGRRA